MKRRATELSGIDYYGQKPKIKEIPLNLPNLFESTGVHQTFPSFTSNLKFNGNSVEAAEQLRMFKRASEMRHAGIPSDDFLSDALGMSDTGTSSVLARTINALRIPQSMKEALKNSLSTDIGAKINLHNAQLLTSRYRGMSSVLKALKKQRGRVMKNKIIQLLSEANDEDGVPVEDKRERDEALKYLKTHPDVEIPSEFYEEYIPYLTNDSPTSKLLQVSMIKTTPVSTESDERKKLDDIDEEKKQTREEQIEEFRERYRKQYGKDPTLDVIKKNFPEGVTATDNETMEAAKHGSASALRPGKRNSQIRVVVGKKDKKDTPAYRWLLNTVGLFPHTPDNPTSIVLESETENRGRHTGTDQTTIFEGNNYTQGLPEKRVRRAPNRFGSKK